MSKGNSQYNPWMDIASYKLEDAHKYKGRDEDIRRFSKMIESKTMSVLYANSGIGKTSFINAGILPLYICEGYYPIRVRFTNDVLENTSICDLEEWMIKQMIYSFEYQYDNVDKNYWNCLLKKPKWKNVSNVSDDQKVESLWWFLHSRIMIDEDGGKIFKPFIIFDQFEEVFSKTNNSFGRHFKERLFKVIEELSSNAVPRKVILFLESIDEKNVDIEFNRKIDIKVIFSLRKEYLSDFDYWTNNQFSIAELFRNRMFLLPLTREQAGRVVVEQTYPNENSCYVETLNDVKDIILDKIDYKNNDEIEPLMLSVLCSRLCDEANSMGQKRLMKQNVESIKLNTLISNFYSEIVTDVIKDTRLLSEFEEEMVDKNNHRNRVKSSLILNGKFDEEYKKVLNGETVKTTYKKELEDRHVIRVERYNGEDYVELIHDRIAEVISTRKDERRRRVINLMKYKSRQNILTLAGRRLMDNCGFDFSASNSRIIVSGDSQSQLKNQKLSSIHSREYDGSDNVFVADILNQIVGNNKLFVHFGGNPTKDGFKALGINTMSFNSQRIINGIVFYGSKESRDSICSADGFNGINIDYDSEGREIRRIYSKSKDGVNVSGVTCYEIAKYDVDGFPLIILFKDENNKPCRHFDGNYGIEFRYDKFGNETYRRYLAEDGVNSCKIYNQICGLKSEYEDNNDRVALQYFVDENGEITEDSYGIVGVKYSYDENSGDLSSIEYIGKDKRTCMNPYGYSIEKFIYKDGKRCQNRYYATDGETLVNRVDSDLCYSVLDIEYDKYDRIKEHILRKDDGSLKLRITYTYDEVGHITDNKYYAEMGFLCVNPSGVHHVHYEYYDNGLLRSQSHLGINGSYVEDINGIHKAIFEWDDHGRLYKRHFYKSNQEKYNSQIFEYESDIWCVVTDITYKDSEGKSLDKPIEEKQKWIINHKFQAKEIIFGEDNIFIPGRPVRVKYKYNIAGDVIEYRLFDIDAELSIPDEDGDYGCQIEKNNTTGETLTKMLDINGKCSKNKHPYAIIVRNNVICQGEESDEEAYFDENYEPVLCELGYHRIVSWQSGLDNADKKDSFLSIFDDGLYRYVEFFDCNNIPCDCVNGFSKQLPEKEQIDGKETNITVSFWGADGSRRINKEYGFHKREQVISTDKEMMEISRSFKDENDELINVRQGFAKQTCKLYDSLWNYFHYPFCDYKVIRFYNKDNKKVDVDFGVNKQRYRAYKYVFSLDWSYLFKVNKASGQTLRIDLLRYFNVIWIPFYIVLLVVYPFYILFNWLYHMFKPQKNVSSEYTSIIQIEQVFDKVSKGKDTIVAPSKSIGIVDGCWIVKWNNWVYNKDNVDNIKLFEEEFNASDNSKSLIIYNPSEKQFFNLRVNEKNLGWRIHDASVMEDTVNEMLEKALDLPPEGNADFLKVICSNLERLYKENGENDKAEKLYRKQIEALEKQECGISPYKLEKAYYHNDIYENLKKSLE